MILSRRRDLALTAVVRMPEWLLKLKSEYNPRMKMTSKIEDNPKNEDDPKNEESRSNSYLTRNQEVENHISFVVQKATAPTDVF